MVSDSIPNASVASPNPRDFAKKKRANRSAKLKQCKRDARREQWLSQGFCILPVKNKSECKEEINGGGVACSGPLMHSGTTGSRRMEKLELKMRNEEIYRDGSPIHHFSDSESLHSNSPTSHTSSVLGSNDSGANFSSSSRTSSSSGRSCNGSCNFYPGNLSEDDDCNAGDDDCLDDWEAMADALASSDNKQQEHSPGLPSSKDREKSTESGSHVESSNQMPSPGSGGIANERAPISCCAWRPDDAYRPQSLPNLMKQYSFPLNSERRSVRGTVWGCKNVGSIPTSCPICFEDLDCTDTSFLPCACGFRLCLFCHKRILEEDGRCPGCRKQYEFESVEGEAALDGGSYTFRLVRSSSMNTRS